MASRKSNISERSEYRLAKGLFQLAQEAQSGAKLTIEYTMKKFKVQKAAAQRYLNFVQRNAGLGTRTRGGRKIVEQPTEAEALFVRAASLTVASVTLSGMKHTSYHRELLKLAAEARGELDHSDQEVLDRVFGRMFVKRREAERPAHYAQVVDRLSEAIRHRRRCRIRYTKLDGTTNDYVLEPWCLTLIGEALFVFGRKLPDGARSFEVTHIQLCDVTPDVFAAPTPYESDPARAFENSIGTYDATGRDPENVVLRARGPARVLLQRRRVHASQRTHDPHADGWATVTLRVWVCPELVSEILSMLPNVVVVEPASLREAVRLAARSVEGSEWDL